MCFNQCRGSSLYKISTWRKYFFIITVYALICLVTPALKAQYDSGLPVNGVSSFDSVDQNFKNPPATFRIIQYFMNKDLDINTVNKLKSYGIGGIQYSVDYKNYLQDNYAWQKADQAIRLAHEEGLRVWIHDERGYPSGAAGGLVVEGYPEYEARGLVRMVEKGTGEQNIIYDLPAGINFLYAHLVQIKEGEPDISTLKEVTPEGRKIETKGLKGAWQLSVFGEKILDKDTQAQSTIKQFGHTGHYPDLLNKDACHRFVSLTHQNYADHVDNMGKKVEAFYTGEANLLSTYWKYDGTEAEYAYVPWSSGIQDEFRMMHGYELRSCMDALFEGSSIQSKTTRLHYYQTIAEMFTKAYAGSISEWCESYGTNSLGHLLLEEYMACHVAYYGNMMKVLRNFNIPACDIPVARENKKDWKYWMAKYISSSAYLENKKSVVNALLDPIIGFGMDDLSPDMDILRRTVNMNYLCGINQLSTYIPYADYSDEEYNAFNEYIGRLSLMLRGAENDAEIAVYYPIETFQARYRATSRPWNQMISEYNYIQETIDNMAKNMLENGLDFNFLMEDAILNAYPEEGYMMCGNHKYSAIVMPHVDVISLDLLRKIRRLSNAGIRVFWVETKPSMGVAMEELESILKISDSVKINNYPLGELKRIVSKESELDISSGYRKSWVAKYRKDDRFVYFLVNDTPNEITINVKSENHENIILYNPVDATIVEQKLPLDLNINGYESVFLVEKSGKKNLSEKRLEKGTTEILKISPNPAHSLLDIAVPEKYLGATLKTWDFQGKLIDIQCVENVNFSKDVSGIIPGIYFLSLNDGKNVQKVVLQ